MPPCTSDARRIGDLDKSITSFYPGRFTTAPTRLEPGNCVGDAASSGCGFVLTNLRHTSARGHLRNAYA